jgi:hypothetical protein
VFFDRGAPAEIYQEFFLLTYAKIQDKNLIKVKHFFIKYREVEVESIMSNYLDAHCTLD